jgi:hypothetical protein
MFAQDNSAIRTRFGIENAFKAVFVLSEEKLNADLRNRQTGLGFFVLAD